MKRSEAVKDIEMVKAWLRKKGVSHLADVMKRLASALERDEWEPEEGAKGPTVLEVTPEGRVIYDPNSVMSCDAARKHLDSLREKIVSSLPPTAREKVEEALKWTVKLVTDHETGCKGCGNLMRTIERLLSEALDAPSGAVPPPTRVSNSTATEEAPEGRTIQPPDPATTPLTDHEIHPLPGKYEP